MDYESLNLGEACNWQSLTEVQPEETKTPVERAALDNLSDKQRHWREKGYLILPRLIPDEILDAYARVREKLPRERGMKDNFWGGWHYPTPYMGVREMRDVALYHTLMHEMHALILDPMGLHLALTGWVSTERNWHQDTYLNPPALWSYYAAAWIALDDIDEDSGPFQMIPGSHLWETIRRERLFEFLTPDQRSSPHWPTTTQDHLARLCEAEIEKRGAAVERFIAKKGDVLIWHSNLMHRGSKPNNPDLLRRSLICHYSSVVRRHDMKRLARHDNGMLYFDLPTSGAVRPV